MDLGIKGWGWGGVDLKITSQRIISTLLKVVNFRFTNMLTKNSLVKSEKTVMAVKLMKPRFLHEAGWLYPDTAPVYNKSYSVQSLSL